ncbi:hypothetical protein ACIA59_33585 [Micromonospora haikouensis]|uniref:hypothetical protein n=1 Tax=Micromonospora haikouensis TaxID=686309 RepID=UPI0037ABEC4F
MPDTGGADELAWGDRESAEPWHDLALGRWSARLTARGIEDVRLDGRRVLTRVLHTVRATDWSTERAALTYTLAPPGRDGPAATFTARYPGHGLDLRGEIRAVPDGFDVAFESRPAGTRTVRVNRVGPAVLHPGDQAGRPVRGHPGGLPAGFAFPRHVARSPVFAAGARMELDLAPTGVVLELDGGEFEVEDHRDWSDDGFKTYTPPLAAPRPIVLRPGDVLRHRLRITAAPTAPGPARARPRRPDVATPAGVMPPLGLQHSGGALPSAALAAVAELRPAFLHLTTDLAHPRWRELLAADATAARALDVPVVLTLVADPTDPGPAAELPGLLGGRLTTVLAFDAGTARTSAALVRALRPRLGAGVTIGGGSRAHLAALLAAPPVDELDVVTFPIASCAHDVDRAAVRSSLDSHPAVLAAATELAGGRPLLVGPVGHLPYWDSWGAATPGPAYGWGPGLARQRSVFHAAWTVAALAGFAAAGVARVSLCHTTGLRGVGEPAGDAFAAYPLWFALRELAGTAGWRRLPGTPPPGTTGLRLRGPAGGLDLLACLADDPPAGGFPPTAEVLHAVAGTLRREPARTAGTPTPCVVVDRQPRGGQP